jgi:hypothetical protein
MTKLYRHIEELRARLSEIASSEKVLVKAFGEALDRLDRQLLRDVRQVASDHEARREAILGELQGLAAGIGMFHAPLRADPQPEQLPRYYTAEEAVAPTTAPGDWREATRNIGDEFGFPLNGRTPAH